MDEEEYRQGNKAMVIKTLNEIIELKDKRINKLNKNIEIKNKENKNLKRENSELEDENNLMKKEQEIKSIATIHSPLKDQIKKSNINEDMFKTIMEQISKQNQFEIENDSCKLW
jgi:uncharacterized membrane protein YgaE (UPF0421/DUF939 family)